MTPPDKLARRHEARGDKFKLLTNFTIRLTNETRALSRQSDPQKAGAGWMEGDYTGVGVEEGDGREGGRGSWGGGVPHLADTGQKSLTAVATPRVTLLMR